MVTMNNVEEIRVLGIFDSDGAGEVYIKEAIGSTILLDTVVVRPILAARPIERSL